MDEDKLKLFHDVALKQGHPEDEINSFIEGIKSNSPFSSIAKNQGYSEIEITPFENMRNTKISENIQPDLEQNFEPLPSGSTSILPGQFSLTQKFGNYNPSVERYSGGVNYGADFATPKGTPLSAPQGQWVVAEAFDGAKEGNRGVNNGWGNSVVIVNSQTGERLRFSHLSKVGVRPGQIVKGGQVFGLTGNTGNSTGPHIDIEYYDQRGRVSDVLKSRYANQLFG